MKKLIKFYDFKTKLEFCKIRRIRINRNIINILSMTKKLVKTISALTIGIATIATIPLISTSCNNGTIPDWPCAFSVCAGGVDSDTTETREYISCTRDFDKYSCTAKENWKVQDLTSYKIYTILSYTTLMFKYTDPNTQEIHILNEDNVRWSNPPLSFGLHVWTTNTLGQDILKIWTRNNFEDSSGPGGDKYYFNVNYGEEYEYRFNIEIKVNIN